MDENVVQTVDETQEVVVYKKETIMDLLRKMDTEMPIRGIDNMRAFVAVFDIINKGGEFQNAVPVHDDEQEEVPTEGVGEEQPIEEVVYVSDSDEEEIPQATGVEITEEEAPEEEASESNSAIQ